MRPLENAENVELRILSLAESCDKRIRTKPHITIQNGLRSGGCSPLSSNTPWLPNS